VHSNAPSLTSSFARPSHRPQLPLQLEARIGTQLGWGLFKRSKRRDGDAIVDNIDAVLGTGPIEATLCQTLEGAAAFCLVSAYTHLA
jgi:hypothetical protein